MEDLFINIVCLIRFFIIKKKECFKKTIPYWIRFLRCFYYFLQNYRHFLSPKYMLIFDYVNGTLRKNKFWWSDIKINIISQNLLCTLINKLSNKNLFIKRNMFTLMSNILLSKIGNFMPSVVLCVLFFKRTSNLVY